MACKPICARSQLCHLPLWMAMKPFLIRDAQGKGASVNRSAIIGHTADARQDSCPLPGCRQGRRAGQAAALEAARAMAAYMAGWCWNAFDVGLKRLAAGLSRYAQVLDACAIARVDAASGTTRRKGKA